jgi:ribosomal protein S18 acetylase RimI-like enzyme
VSIEAKGDRASTPAEDSIRRLARAEISAAAGLLAIAFDDDPTATRFRDARRRRRVLETLAEAVLRDAVEHGQVDATWSDDRLLGVIVWYPPSRHPPSLSRLLRTFVPAGFRLLTIDPVTAILAVPSILRDGRRWAPADAWYLQAVAVDTGDRSKGIGTALVLAGLREADANGQASYLRTSHRATIPWYARLGFVVIDSAAHVDADARADTTRRIRMRRQSSVRAG